jgi:hypothetical protein
MARAARYLRPLQDELLREEPFDPSTTTRPIVLALSDIAEMAFLPSILAHLRAHAPKCAVRTVFAADAEVTNGRRIRHGQRHHDQDEADRSCNDVQPLPRHAARQENT